MARTVWITRHGNREDFVDPEWYKTAERPYDPGLSTDGIRQAEQLAERLAAEGVAHIFASPFLRTVHTASIVADALDRRIFLEPGLSEWMNPDWFPEAPGTQSREELARLFPRIDLNYEARGAAEYPETEAQALRRSGRTAAAIAASCSASVLLVGHGISVTGAAHGLVPGVEILECALCSLFRADRKGDRWDFGLIGDVSHLDTGEAADRYN